jgi:hypothetical protein
MTNEDILKRVRYFIEEGKTSNRWSDAELIRDINQALRYYISRLHEAEGMWFAKDTYVTLTKGASSLPLPSDCAGNIKNLGIKGQSYMMLKPSAYNRDYICSNYSSEPEEDYPYIKGQPTNYEVVHKSINFNRIADRDYAIQIRYDYYPPFVSEDKSNIEEENAFPDAVVEVICLDAACSAIMKDQGDYTYHMQRLAVWRGRLDEFAGNRSSQLSPIRRGMW